jgi:hypothetical protein
VRYLSLNPAPQTTRVEVILLSSDPNQSRKLSGSEAVIIHFSIKTKRLETHGRYALCVCMRARACTTRPKTRGLSPLTGRRPEPQARWQAPGQGRWRCRPP